jgi:hypothetical protein
MGDRAMAAADIVAKFRASAQLAYSVTRIERLEHVVLHLEDTSANTLADAVGT